jgi:ankyrin repeat protein
LRALSCGAEVDSVNPCYGTALHSAALFGCVVKTSILLGHGADPLAYSVAHQSAIHAAAIHDHEDVLALLLKSTHEGIDYDATNPEAVNRILLFRSTCADALRCATLRGCNSAILSLLEYTDEVHVKTAIASSNESTKSIIVGEAHRNGALTMGECMDLPIQEGPDYDLLL